jgi:hypothetical protein
MLLGVGGEYEGGKGPQINPQKDKPKAFKKREINQNPPGKPPKQPEYPQSKKKTNNIDPQSTSLPRA